MMDKLLPIEKQKGRSHGDARAGTAPADPGAGPAPPMAGCAPRSRIRKETMKETSV